MVASVPELRSERVGVDPVDVGEHGAREEVGAVLRQRDGGHAPEDLALYLDFHRALRDPRDGPVTGANQDVPIRQHRRASDAQGETLLGALLLEQCALQKHLQQVACRCAAIDKLIFAVDQHVGGDALQGSHIHLRGPELLVGEVELPDDDVVVASCNKVELRVIEEAHAMCGVRRGWRAANSSATLHLPDHEAVVVLAAQRRQVLLVPGKAEGGDSDLVQGQPVELPPAFEVPDDDVCRESHEGLLPRGEESS
mmetsp:Transcript_12195/g.34578  ORF Transcript_12195/g.34578 Transcript_12195/m.34578 type:complete len:254 (+) Transcript_12195:1055-1816(+)